MLDPVFIFVFRWGVRGAAVNTVLSQMASCAYVRPDPFQRAGASAGHLRGIRLADHEGSFLIGLSPFLIIAFDNILIIALNTVIQKYGSGANETCCPIDDRSELYADGHHAAAAVLPADPVILGYSYGARRRNESRRRGPYRDAGACVYTTVMFTIARTPSQFFVRIFFTQNETTCGIDCHRFALKSIRWAQFLWLRNIL